MRGSRQAKPEMEAYIHPVAPADVGAIGSNLVEVYELAFCAPPYEKTTDEVEDFARFLPHHAAESGFRLVVAADTSTGETLGFAYGRSIASHQTWHRVVEPFLRAAGLEGWLVDAFLLSEMAVRPSVQRRGIGSRLHERLLEDLPHRNVVLTTMAGETPAYHFYRTRGWRVLWDELSAPGLPRAYHVMGLRLPAKGKAGPLPPIREP